MIRSGAAFFQLCTMEVVPLVTAMILRRFKTSMVCCINSSSVFGDQMGFAQDGSFCHLRKTSSQFSFFGSSTGNWVMGRQKASEGGPCESADNACRCMS